MNNTQIAQNVNTMLNGIPELDESNVGNHLLEMGLFVKVHVGRMRYKLSMPKSVLGIDKDDPFYQDYGETGCFSLLKKKDEAELQRIEGSIRRKLYELSIMQNFMLMADFNDVFIPSFDKDKNDYLAKRDELCTRWDKIVEEFKTALHNFLITQPTYSPEIEKALTANIPTVEAFKNSFYMYYTIDTFPVVNKSLARKLSKSNPALAAEMKRSVHQQAIDAVFSIMSNLMNEANDTLAQRIVAYTNGKPFNGHAINALTSLKDKLTKNNVFNDAMVIQICSELAEIISKIEERKVTLNVSLQASLDEEIVNRMENSMIHIYGYCKAHELALNDNPALSIADMEIMYQAALSEDE